MKKIGWMMAGLVVAGSLVFAAEEGGATVSLSADVSSAYVFRGITWNDGLVVQPGLEVGGLPVTIGVWGNYDVDDYDEKLNDAQFSEIDLYASYGLPVEVVDLSVSYTEYTYPGGVEADREAGLTLGLPVVLSPYVSVYYGIDGSYEKNVYAEVGAGYDYAVNDDTTIGLSAAAGYLSPDEGDDGMMHYTGSLSASYKLLSASVTYVGQGDDKVLPDAAMDEEGNFTYGHDVEVFGTIGIAKDF